MTIGLNLVTAPLVEPVSLTEAKDHMRVTVADEDAHIDQLITTARETAETYCRRALITQTWDWTIDRFPPVLRIPLPPLQSIVTLKYLDSDGIQQTLDAAEYRVDIAAQPGRVTPAWEKVWPTIRPVTGAVVVQFTAGFGPNPADVPAQIRHGMLLLIGRYYEHREDIVAGVNVMGLPDRVENLWRPERIDRFDGWLG